VRTCFLSCCGLAVFALLCAAQNADPKAAQGYIDRASALCREARDTGKSALYSEASAAIDRALELSPANHEALKLQVAVLLGLHDFSEALRRAKELAKDI
jgi:uncharacterized protein HemY